MCTIPSHYIEYGESRKIRARERERVSECVREVAREVEEGKCTFLSSSSREPFLKGAIRTKSVGGAVFRGMSCAVFVCSRFFPAFFLLVVFVVDDDEGPSSSRPKHTRQHQQSTINNTATTSPPLARMARRKRGTLTGTGLKKLILF